MIALDVGVLRRAKQPSKLLTRHNNTNRTITLRCIFLHESISKMQLKSPTRLNTATSRCLGSSVMLVALFVLTIVLASPVHAQSGCDDVSGEWSVNLDLPGGGPTDVILNLEQNECEVVGFIEGQRKTPIENGTVEGPTANFTATAANQAGGPPVVIAWEITVDGTDLIGTFSHELMGSIEFVGTKVED